MIACPSDNGVCYHCLAVADHEAWSTDVPSENPRVYSVWVGGSEMNDTYLSIERAVEVHNFWVQDNYDDVVIRQELA